MRSGSDARPKRPMFELQGSDRIESRFCDMLAPLEYARCALRADALADVRSQGKGKPANGLSVLVGSARDAR